MKTKRVSDPIRDGTRCALSSKWPTTRLRLAIQGGNTAKGRSLHLHKREATTSATALPPT